MQGIYLVLTERVKAETFINFEQKQIRYNFWKLTRPDNCGEVVVVVPPPGN